MECFKCKSSFNVETKIELNLWLIGGKSYCHECFTEEQMSKQLINKEIVYKNERILEFESENEKHRVAKIKALNSESGAIRSKILERHELLINDLTKEKNSLLTQLDDLVSINLEKINNLDITYIPKKIDSTVENNYKTRFPLNYVFANKNDVFKILNEINYDSKTLDFKYEFFPLAVTSQPKNLLGTIKYKTHF
jgi:hypothetical protein